MNALQWYCRLRSWHALTILRRAQFMRVVSISKTSTRKVCNDDKDNDDEPLLSD